MEYIAHLLRSPDREVTAVQLFKGVAGQQGTPIVASAGDVLDRVAIKEYRSRVENLEYQINEAERNNDQGSKEMAQTELHQFTEQLVSAVGLGGRPRIAHDDAEKIRKAVAVAIGRAITLVGKYHPALAKYLDSRIERGSYLRYRGDEEDWQF